MIHDTSNLMIDIMWRVIKMAAYTCSLPCSACFVFNNGEGSEAAQVEAAKRETLGIIKRAVDWHGRKSVILKQHSCVVGVFHIVSIAEQARDRKMWW